MRFSFGGVGGPWGGSTTVLLTSAASSQRREDYLARARGGLAGLDSVAGAAEKSGEDHGAGDPLISVQDNDTRWNSWYTMIERALAYRDAIDLFTKRQVEKGGGASNIKLVELSGSDLDIINRVKQVLEPYHQLTRRTEGRAEMGSHGALREALPVIEYLLDALERKA
jgi:hypothetical protein